MSALYQEYPRRHPISVEDYYRMAEAGILREDARVELIEGVIFDMTPIGKSHAGTVRYLTHMLSQAVGRRAQISIQNPVRLSRFSEAQPDLALLRFRETYYRDGHPEPGDVLLIIEVADTSREYDREVKMPLYARHGIPEAWLVDLENSRLEVFRDPRSDGYRDIRIAAALDRLPLPGLPGTELNLSDLFAT